MKNKEKKIVGDVKSFIVKRKNWCRGKGSHSSCLANNANNLCCLGFYAEACGLNRKIIRNITDPLAAVNLTKVCQFLIKTINQLMMVIENQM